MKIVHIITSLGPGGAERMLHNLVVNTDRSLFDSYVISLTDMGIWGEAISARGIPVIALNMRRAILTPLPFIRLITILRSIRPHLVQTWLYHADFLGTLACKLCGFTIVWNVRCSNMDLGQYSLLTSVVLKILGKLSGIPTVIISNSLAGKESHQKLGYRSKNWTLIPNGFDVGTYAPSEELKISLRSEWQIPKTAVLIGMVARFDPMKDHETFLKAASILKSNYPNVLFLLAGKGITPDNKKLGCFIEQNGLVGKVVLLGEQGNMPKIYNSLDIFTLASVFGEGFPNVIGEAMSCGVPCIVTDVGDSAMLVDKTGLAIPPRNPKALAHAWEKMIEIGAGNRLELGIAARKRIIEHFSIENVVRQYETLYSNVLLQ